MVTHTGIYLGHSSCHTGLVAFVLNLATGLVSPQYNLAFDDNFYTVPYPQPSTEPPTWKDVLKNPAEHATHEHQYLSYEWLHPEGNRDPNYTALNDTPVPVLEETPPHAPIAITPTYKGVSWLPSEVLPTSRGVSIISQSKGGGSSKDAPFLNTETLGLHIGGRKKTSTAKKERRITDPNNKSLALHKPRTL